MGPLNLQLADTMPPATQPYVVLGNIEKLEVLQPFRWQKLDKGLGNFRNLSAVYL
jgi:hypothetical protein